MGVALEFGRFMYGLQAPPLPLGASTVSATGMLADRSAFLDHDGHYSRGPMMVGGVTKLLPALTDERACAAGSSSASAAVPVCNSQAGAIAAAHSPGCCLITPTRLPRRPPAQAAAVQPLLRVLRESTGQLAMFEAAMDLTNLVSVSGSEEARARALDAMRGGLDAIEFFQFSERKMLWRVATEALSDLTATEEGLCLILRSRLGLWLALARGYERPEAGNRNAAAGSCASAAAAPKGKPKPAAAA